MQGISSWRLILYGACLLVAGIYAATKFRDSSTLEVGKTAPQVTVDLPNGEQLDLQAPGRVVLLSFWASWCEPCRKEAPILNDLQQQALVLGISVEDADPASAAKLAKGLGMEFTIIGGRQDLAQTFQVEALPTVYVLAPDGTITFAQTGVADQSTLERAIAEADLREI